MVSAGSAAGGGGGGYCARAGEASAPASSPATVSTRSAMAPRYAHRGRTRKGGNHLDACAAQRGQHLLAVGADRPERVGLADELQADRRRAELLHPADALDG